MTKVSGVAALLAMLLAGCRSGQNRAPALGEAYVGPASMQLRSDTTPQSPVVATVRHGDRLEILQQKRKLLLVRTAGGAEGWTEERQLLASSDMAALKELSQRAAKLPAQGQATTYADLRVHTQPSYQAPSFLVIKANEKFDVMASVLLPRTEVARAPLVPPAPKKSKSERKTSQKNAKLLPPPLPRPPVPPPNWLELSKSTLPQPVVAPEEPRPDKPEATDRWSLIRMPSGESGWVYTRLITMAIPDEVAQYAEGHRIVSYFPLGAVQDGEQKKTIWLWTTIGSGNQPYDFDSFRVFIWSQRHRRYETAHVELHLKGYAPVLLDSVPASGNGKSKGETTGRTPGFSVCVQKKDGERYRREYALLNGMVRFVSEQACEPPPPSVTVKAPTPLPGGEAASAAQPKETFLERMKKRWHALKRSLSGG